MIRLALVVVLSALPLAASAVELPGELVQTEQAVEVDAAEDHRAAWEAYLRAERSKRLQDLHAYMRAGRFPQKDEPGWHHQFLDSNDVPCAVASLIWTSGNERLVRRTARRDNDVVLSELDDGPLVDWVLTSGLTMEEVAVIQVPGFNGGRDRIDIAQVDPQAQEVARVRRHLANVHRLILVDTESSIAKALDRLGDRLQSPPPSATPG